MASGDRRHHILVRPQPGRYNSAQPARQMAGVELGAALEIAARVASARSEAHAAGIVHHDLKPEDDQGAGPQPIQGIVGRDAKGTLGKLAGNCFLTGDAMGLKGNSSENETTDEHRMNTDQEECRQAKTHKTRKRLFHICVHLCASAKIPKGAGGSDTAKSWLTRLKNSS